MSDKSISRPGETYHARPALFSALPFSANRFLFKAFSVSLLLGLLTIFSSQAQSWRRLGPPGGEVISLAADSAGTVYLGTPDGHVFASADRGEHWEIRGRAGGRLDGVVQHIVTDDQKPGRLLAAVWFQDLAAGGGVFESQDGAGHWKLAGLAGEAVRALEHSESDPSIWVAGTRSGVFRSADDAHTWQRITPSGDRELQNVDSLAVDPVHPEIIYVGTYHLPWKTIDGGKTWFSIASGMIDDSDIMSFRIDAKNPRRIFSSACSGIYRSDDAGASWTKLQGIPYGSRRTQQIVQDPADPRTLYSVTTEGLWRTSDWGENWQRMTPRETVANALVVLPGAKSVRVLAGTDAQGVLRSDDGADFFPAPNDGFSHRVIESLAADSSDSSHLVVRIAGYSDLLLETHDTGNSWAEFPVDPPTKPVSHLYGSASGWWLSFADGGLTQYDFASRKWRLAKFREPAPFATPAQKSARSQGASRAAGPTRTVSPRVLCLLEWYERVIVASDDGLWFRNTHETEFHRIHAKNLPLPVSYLSVGPGNSLLAIAANSLWKGDSEASVWSALAAPLNSGSFLWIHEDSNGNAPSRLLGTQNGVFRSVSGGPWRLLGSGLPAISSQPPAFAGSIWLFAMNNGGIYQSVDSGNTWVRIDTDAELGKVSAVMPAGDHNFAIASQSEGLLVFPMHSPTNH